MSSFPVRCFTCNKIIGKYEEKYNELLNSGVSKKIALDSIGMSRYCCRRMFLCHVNIIDKLLLFPKDIPNTHNKKIEKS
jgi:DNA-directed RNA polymerase I, II, and III subunit RPABC5